MEDAREVLAMGQSMAKSTMSKNYFMECSNEALKRESVPSLVAFVLVRVSLEDSLLPDAYKLKICSILLS
jgi:hypothetical protein